MNELEATCEAAASPAAPEARPAAPRAVQMEGMLQFVHGVFLGHGFARSRGEGECSEGADVERGPGPLSVRYEHESHRPIAATYVPLHGHLVVHASREGKEGVSASLQPGMPAETVQAKVEYLLLYPLLYHQCAPAMASLPPDVCFGVLAALAIPALAVVGCASRGLSSAALDDDAIWWRVLTALPPSSYLHSQVEATMAARKRGEAIQPGTYRRLVRDEVARAREEAEQQRLRQEAQTRLRGLLHDPLLVQPGFLSGQGHCMIGGPYDLPPCRGCYF
uniref:Uncharacterized protein n=1 Tax=Alexandrium monilatum TaxID=311494 RepID=A0A6T1CFH5_9DINO|mmetsp:Transcript_81318/g.251025  ORF Transcript_81318/g.251025 Transcript_81318/m.251025 type:complete len:278 (+) Transcript_81318:75-908(+)